MAEAEQPNRPRVPNPALIWLVAAYVLCHAATYVPWAITKTTWASSMPTWGFMLLLAPSYTRILLLHAIVLTVVMFDLRVWVGLAVATVAFLLAIRPEVSVIAEPGALEPFVHAFGLPILFGYALSLLGSPFIARFDYPRHSELARLSIARLLLVSLVFAVSFLLFQWRAGVLYGGGLLVTTAVEWFVGAMLVGVVFAPRLRIRVLYFLSACVPYVAFQTLQFGGWTFAGSELWFAALALAFGVALAGRAKGRSCFA